MAVKIELKGTLYTLWHATYLYISSVPLKARCSANGWDVAHKCFVHGSVKSFNCWNFGNTHVPEIEGIPFPNLQVCREMGLVCATWFAEVMCLRQLLFSDLAIPMVIVGE